MNLFFLQERKTLSNSKKPPREFSFSIPHLDEVETSCVSSNNDFGLFHLQRFKLRLNPMKIEVDKL